MNAANFGEETYQIICSIAICVSAFVAVFFAKASPYFRDIARRSCGSYSFLTIMTYKDTIDFLFSQLAMYQQQGPSAYKPGLEPLALDRVFSNPSEAVKGDPCRGDQL